MNNRLECGKLIAYHVAYMMPKVIMALSCGLSSRRKATTLNLDIFGEIFGEYTRFSYSVEATTTFPTQKMKDKNMNITEHS